MPIEDLAIETDAAPDYRFRLGSQVDVLTLVRHGAFMAILREPRWADPQRPPPDSFDEASEIFLVTEEKFDWFRAAVAGLEVKRYASLTDRDLVPAPPDASWSVLLTLEEEGRSLLDLRRSAVGLPDHLQKPLTELKAYFAEEMALSAKEPILPQGLFVLLESPLGKAPVFVLDDGGPGWLGGEGTPRRPASTEDLRQIWKLIRAERLAFRSYLDEPLAPKDRDTRLRIQVNGYTLIDATTRLDSCAQKVRLRRLFDRLSEKSH